MATDTHARMLASLVGNPVRNSTGENIGRIEGLIADSETGQIMVAVSSGSETNDERPAQLPWNALRRSTVDGVLYLSPRHGDADREVIVYTCPVHRRQVT
ncbi:MAG: PRC-barrel domain-containing protein [Chloroflexi bacterium]|nr:PRC-barrel domain-containing protein [Chloroflexota bacterium]